MPEVRVTELMHRDAEGGEQIAVDIRMAGCTYSVSLYEREDGRHELTVNDKTNGDFRCLAVKKFDPTPVKGQI